MRSVTGISWVLIISSEGREGMADAMPIDLTKYSQKATEVCGRFIESGILLYLLGGQESWKKEKIGSSTAILVAA